MEVIYAIGDIHGEASRLDALHAAIFERHAFCYKQHALKIIHLGDYVDRGPESARVIDVIMALERRIDLTCINLKGNHETMMLEGVTEATEGARSFWLSYGGDETLKSYRARGANGVETAHLDWIAQLPPIHVEETRKMIFVHAGIDPSTYPDNSENTYLWTRSPRFFNVGDWRSEVLQGWTVVHGHTPTRDDAPDVQIRESIRINLDTGAFAGGPLTAGIFAPGERVQFISA